MSFLVIKIVNEPSGQTVDIEDITHTGLGVLISDCAELLEKLEEAALDCEDQFNRPARLAGSTPGFEV